MNGYVYIDKYKFLVLWQVAWSGKGSNASRGRCYSERSLGLVGAVVAEAVMEAVV